MTQPNNQSSAFADATLGGIIGTVIGSLLLLGIAALWTGTVAGPSNPDFWRQAAPFAFLLVILLLLWIRPTRRLIWGIVRWTFGLRILTRKQRAELDQPKSTPNPPPSIRVSPVPGLTKHGRLNANQNLRTNALKVTWANNGMYVGTLEPSKGGRWEVLYGEHHQSLGFVDSKTVGMELLEKTDVAETKRLEA